MVRKGIRRTHTGCTTCKIRRIKCDETHPNCTKCTSTGRKCDGYTTWVPKAVQRQTQTIQPSSIPGAGAAGSQFLDFFRLFLAPVLEGPLPHSFWTYTVPQMVHQEPGLRDAVVALASLYQKFREDTQTEAEKRFSIGRYNSAIRQIALLRQGNLDTVVIACGIFMSIDILCGNHEQALLHYRYGKRILESYTPNAQIKGIFRQMHMFVLFTSPSGLLLLEKDGCPHITQPIWSLLQAQEELDWLVYRSMEVVYFVNKHCEESIILPAQYELNQELDNWFLAVSDLVSQDLPIRERAAFHMLEARWLICKIWCHGSLYGDHGYEDSTDMFRRGMELLRELMAMVHLKALSRSESHHFAFTLHEIQGIGSSAFSASFVQREVLHA